MKKTFLAMAILLIVAGLIAGTWLLIRQPNPPSNSPSQCEIKEITFYYLDQCGWCQKVKSEGTIDKIEALGGRVNKINAAIGPIRHKFESVPTFVINDKVYSGYKTFEELEELLGCAKTENQPSNNKNQPQSLPKIQFSGEKGETVNLENGEVKLTASRSELLGCAKTENQPSNNKNQPQSLPKIQFSGEKGETVNLENGEVKLTASTFNNNQARFYNMELPLGKTIYFFVVKDKNGIYRAAANACAVCFKTYK